MMILTCQTPKSILQIFYILLIINALPFYAQADIYSGNISGHIKTVDGSPAAFVNVIIKGVNKGTVTDENGYFNLKNLKDGSYTIVTSFVGLQSQEKTVSIQHGQPVILDFELLENAQQLAEIIVTGTLSGNEKTASLGKVAIKAFDLPQSVMVIDKTILERQQVHSLSDVLMNTNGVYVMGTTGGTQDEIAGRGFSFSGSNGVSNTFKNGARYNNAIRPELSALEKVEILKGSNAILFGNVAPGGVLNLVTKKPVFEQGGTLSFRAGSYGFYKPSLDVYGAVNNSNHVAFRMNTSYENSKSFRDVVSIERVYFNPSVLIKAGKKTDILLEGDYLKDNRTQDFGTGAIDYEIINLSRNQFLGAAWSYNKAEQKSATVTINHSLNSTWQLTGVTSYQGFNNDAFGTTRPNASNNFIKPNGQWVRGLQRTKIAQDYIIGQLDATAKFHTGTVSHTLLIGVDMDRYATNNTTTFVYKNAAAGGKNVYDTINVFDLNEYKQRSDIPTLDLNTLTQNPIKRAGAYIQNLVGITEKLKVLAGLRYSYMETKSNVLTYATNKETTNIFYADAFTPRFGIVYQPIKDISLFTSYANSFSLNTGIDASGNNLPPSFIDQFEAGVKSDLYKGLLSANITAYKIVNSNLAQPVIGSTTNAQELAGEVTSKGIEVDLSTKSFHGFSVLAGYSYNDTRYTKSTLYIVNSRLRYNPQHTANASAYYAFSNVLKGLNLGIIGFYMGDRVAGRSTQVTTPNDTRKLMPIANYFQFDVSAGYTFNAISIRLKVSNVLNQLSYNVHDDNSVNPIAPRQVAATLTCKL